MVLLPGDHALMPLGALAPDMLDFLAAHLPGDLPDPRIHVGDVELRLRNGGFAVTKTAVSVIDEDPVSRNAGGVGAGQSGRPDRGAETI